MNLAKAWYCSAGRETEKRVSERHRNGVNLESSGIATVRVHGGSRRGDAACARTRTLEFLLQDNVVLHAEAALLFVNSAAHNVFHLLHGEEDLACLRVDTLAELRTDVSQRLLLRRAGACARVDVGRQTGEMRGAPGRFGR